MGAHETGFNSAQLRTCQSSVPARFFWVGDKKVRVLNWENHCQVLHTVTLTPHRSNQW